MSSSLPPVDFVIDSVNRLRSQGKNISVRLLSPEYSDFFLLYINDCEYGLWGSIGLAAVISKYLSGGVGKRDYARSNLGYFNLPAKL